MSSSSHSDRSETSTVVYSHEPFIAYQTRVFDLLCTLYGSQIAKSAQVTRLPGGGFNRIVGITLRDGSNIGIPVLSNLILRVPRFDHTDVAVQVNLLQALVSSLPVPEIERYDPGSDNPLGQPYILMRRLSGQSLNDTILEMTTNDRCRIAKQVAQLIAKIHGVTLPLGIGPLLADDTGKISIGQFPLYPDWVKNSENKGDFWIATSFHAFVSSRIAQFRAHAKQQVPPDTFHLKLLDRFSSASASLLDAYARPHSSVVLFHRDFAARNLVVSHDPSVSMTEWSITGVLDWDEAESAPLEIASIWPSWLWASDQEGESDFDEDECDLDMLVPDDKCRRIKKSFIDEIDKLEPEFLEAVRRARDGCLRLVYERAREGFFSNEHVKELDRIEAAAKKLSIAKMAKLSS